MLMFCHAFRSRNLISDDPMTRTEDFTRDASSTASGADENTRRHNTTCASGKPRPRSNEHQRWPTDQSSCQYWPRGRARSGSLVLTSRLANPRVVCLVAGTLVGHVEDYSVQNEATLWRIVYAPFSRDPVSTWANERLSPPVVVTSQRASPLLAAAWLPGIPYALTRWW